MSARVTGLCLLVALLTSSCRGPGPSSSTPERGLNLVLLVVDTLRADHLGCYGYARSTSPQIDALARESVLFEQAQSHSPWTMPSVASLFTSLEPRVHGLAEWRQPLDGRLLTLAEQLQARGFRTEGYVSHGVLSRFFQFDQGFDVYDSSVMAGRLPRNISTAREVTDLALGALARLQAQPRRFFLWVHYFDPHDAYLKHDGFDFGPRPVDLYDSEIAFTDQQIGRLLDQLRRSGLAEKTLLALVADHGEGFGAHRRLYHTSTLFDELLRVPLLLRVPGLRPARVRAPVPLIDIAPTLLTLLGEPVPPAFQGRALPLVAGRFVPPPERVMVAETRRFADLRSVRVGRHKLIVDRAPQGLLRLYDLEPDPGEQRNLRREAPELALRLSALLQAQYAAGTASAPRRELPSDVEEKLRSLGYVQ
jgi:arylsulfatase A-like enzyme